MPMFDLVCNNCSTEMNDILIKKDFMECCPRCKELMVKKIGKLSFSLKGSSWAKDGYK